MLAEAVTEREVVLKAASESEVEKGAEAEADATAEATGGGVCGSDIGVGNRDDIKGGGDGGRECSSGSRSGVSS